MKTILYCIAISSAFLSVSCGENSTSPSVEQNFSSDINSSVVLSSTQTSSGTSSTDLLSSQSSQSSQESLSSSDMAPPEVLNLTGDSGIFIDSRDQQKYRWVRIGSQYWMRQNMNYSPTGTHESDSLLGVLDLVGEQAPTYDLRKDDGSSLDPNGVNTIGRFYTQKAGQTICPSGWRLPSKSDFTSLAYAAGMFNNSCSYSSEFGSNFGEYYACANVLKSRYGWINSQNGFDTLGFEGTPTDGSSVEYWTNSLESGNNYTYYALYYHFVIFSIYDDPETEFKTVRCIANQTTSSSTTSSSNSSTTSSASQVYNGGSLIIPQTPETILVGAGTYSPSYSTSCKMKTLLMQDCSVTIGNITMSSIEVYRGLPSSLSVNNSSCQLSCQ